MCRPGVRVWAGEGEGTGSDGDGVCAGTLKALCRDGTIDSDGSTNSALPVRQLEAKMDAGRGVSVTC